jgi:hypothetical protein
MVLKQLVLDMPIYIIREYGESNLYSTPKKIDIQQVKQIGF